jgi:AcrR family transcriptional regulator
MSDSAHWKAKANRESYDAMRERLTSAAWDYACVNGLNKLTLNAVAERAGCARSSVYRYFDSKEELLGAVLQDRVLSIGRELDDELRRWSDPREQFVRGLYRAVNMIRTGPGLELFRTVMVDEGRQIADIALEAIPAIAPDLMTLGPIYTSAREEGLIRAELSDEDILRWMLIVGMSLVQQSPGEDEDAELAYLRKMLVPSIFRDPA